MRVENSSFGYWPERKLLNGLSLAVEQGKVIDALGPNGTGKKTLLKCIERIDTAERADLVW